MVGEVICLEECGIMGFLPHNFSIDFSVWMVAVEALLPSEIPGGRQVFPYLVVDLCGELVA